MQDAWRAYLELALGLTEASRKRAQAAARKLVGSSGATAAQLQTMAEELISTGMANREALTRLVRAEVDRALGVLGLATSDEVAALSERVQRLERELAAVRAAGAATTPGGSATTTDDRLPGEEVAEPTPATDAGTARPRKATTTPVAKKTVAKKAVAKKPGAGKTLAEQPSARKAVAKKSTGTTTVAKRAGGRAVATKGAAQRATAGRGAAAPSGPDTTGTPPAVTKTSARKAPTVRRPSAGDGGAA